MKTTVWINKITGEIELWTHSGNRPFKHTPLGVFYYIRVYDDISAYELHQKGPRSFSHLEPINEDDNIL